MAKKRLSAAFVENIGKGRDPSVFNGPDGRLTSKKSEFGKALASSLLNDPEYQQTLQERLRTGTAGPIEVYLWRKAFGDPEKDDSLRAAEEERFKKIREELRMYMENHHEKARVLDAVVTGAPRLLPLPRLPRQIDDDEAETEPA